MTTFKNVLVGLDYSEASKRALKQAARLARGEGTGLIVLHAISPRELEDLQNYHSLSTDEILAGVKKGIQDSVDEALGPKNTADCKVYVGSPYLELKRAAEFLDCDLLVLGSRGDYSGEGSTGFFAARCARHSSIPVLLVRKGQAEVFRRVVACVDFSEVTPAVICTAAKVAVDGEATLHVIHATCPPWMRPGHLIYNLETVENNDYKAQFREMLEARMDAAIRASAKFFPGNLEHSIIEHPNAGQGILNFLDEEKAELAVVGRSGHTGQAIKEFLIGSTAERLVHRSRCSVLTVPLENSLNQDIENP